jgi:hypothetical protein
MAYTGGPLNELNGKMGISAPNRSVPVMKLIKIHQPKSKEALVQLIEYHYKNECKCGVVSKGTIEMFGGNLYEAQIKHWGEYRYSLKECIQWEYDLFVVNSLRGGRIEKTAIKYLEDNLTNFVVTEAEGYVDEELRVDIIISKNDLQIAGIQVKPLTFKLMRKEVILFNKTANVKWGKPVFYLYYNRQDEFTNFENVIAELKKL